MRVTEIENKMLNRALQDWELQVQGIWAKMYEKTPGGFQSVPSTLL